MESLFYKVLEMSLMGSIVILITVLARFILKNRSKRFIMILWAVVALRLLVPVSLESSLSIFNFIPLQTQTLPAASQVHDAAMPDDHAAKTAKTDAQYITIARTPGSTVQYTPSEELGSAYQLPDIKTVLCAVWLIGAGGITGFYSVRYIQLKRKLKSARNIGGNVYVSEKISTPFVFGLFVPRIYLPDMLGQTEKEYVLLHEKTHIKHGDWLIKIIGMFAVAIHWFNPLVWLAYMLFEQDIEMSCDESVVAGIDTGLKQAYTMSIVSYARKSSSKRYLVTPLGFSKVNFSKTEVTNRVKNIINFKKGRTVTTIAITAALIIVGVVFGLNSKTNADVAENEAGASEEATEATSSTASEAVSETSSAVTSSEAISEVTSESSSVPSSATSTEPAAEATDKTNAFVAYAKTYADVPYTYAGSSSAGVDSSGLVAACYMEYYSISLPHSCDQIMKSSGREVSRDELQEGDVICYDNGGFCGHTAIYIGDGKVIHASNKEGRVVYGDLDMMPIMGIKRIVE